MPIGGTQPAKGAWSGPVPADVPAKTPGEGPANPEDKLAPELREVIVAASIHDNTFTVGRIHVKNARVAVRVRFTASGNNLLVKLRGMGFHETGRSRTMLNGSIDASQLDAVSRIPEVTRIDPVF
jgi:hypothetical protein